MQILNSSGVVYDLITGKKQNKFDDIIYPIKTSNYYGVASFYKIHAYQNTFKLANIYLAFPSNRVYESSDYGFIIDYPDVGDSFIKTNIIDNVSITLPVTLKELYIPNFTNCRITFVSDSYSQEINAAEHINKKLNEWNLGTNFIRLPMKTSIYNYYADRCLYVEKACFIPASGVVDLDKYHFSIAGEITFRDAKILTKGSVYRKSNVLMMDRLTFDNVYFDKPTNVYVTSYLQINNTRNHKLEINQVHTPRLDIQYLDSDMQPVIINELDGCYNILMRYGTLEIKNLIFNGGFSEVNIDSMVVANKQLILHKITNGTGMKCKVSIDDGIDSKYTHRHLIEVAPNTEINLETMEEKSI